MSRKFIKIMLVLAVLTVSLTLLLACQSTMSDTKGTCTVVIENNGSYTTHAVEISDIPNAEEGKLTIYSVLEHLVNAKGMHLVANDSDYGKYIYEIGGLVPNSETSYIAVYTSVTKDFDTSQYAKTIKYENVELSTSGLGVESASIKKNAVFLFKIEKF